MKIAVIDNYDSFTYNLVAMIRDLGYDFLVMRNDQINEGFLDESSHIILSPGPGIPDEAGELKNVISRYAESKRILGICLGHQALAEVFGAQLINMARVYHGISSEIKLKKDILFEGLKSSLKVGRYHSWSVDSTSDLGDFEIIAESEDGEIMGLKHKTLELRGLQFHPESILTPQGNIILKNFLES